MATLTVGMHEAKVHFSEYAHRVEQGDSIVVTRHGKPAMRMMPISEVPTEDVVTRRNAAIDRWLESRKGVTLGGLKIKDLINEGRR